MVEQFGRTALHMAARNDSPQIAQLLLATKATVDVTTKVRAACRWIHADSDSAAVVGQYGRNLKASLIVLCKSAEISNAPTLLCNK